MENLRLLEVIVFITDRRHDRDEYTQHSPEQQGEQCDTRLIISTTGAAATLPHAKQHDTHMMSEQGNQSSA